jgi:hypothetical protein
MAVSFQLLVWQKRLFKNSQTNTASHAALERTVHGLGVAAKLSTKEEDAILAWFIGLKGGDFVTRNLTLEPSHNGWRWLKNCLPTILTSYYSSTLPLDLPTCAKGVRKQH